VTIFITEGVQNLRSLAKKGPVSNIRPPLIIC